MNQKQKALMDNIEEDERELMLLPKKNRIYINIMLFIFHH